jgi:D-glycero-D-manno-heptose 1,7-bisphosphate phosphatase
VAAALSASGAGTTARSLLALLDRDGTLNAKPREGEYVERPEDLVLLPDAVSSVRRLNDADVRVAVVTNQRGVALGRMTLADVTRVNARLHAMLATHGAWLDLVLACPHHIGDCDCRKPAPGMLVEACNRLGIPPARATMIGDSSSDVEAGRRAGTRTIGIGDGAGAADVVVPSLGLAVAHLLTASPG